MTGKNTNAKIYGGYAILTLQSLGYNDEVIKNFISEFGDKIEQINEIQALKIMDNFYDDSRNHVQVIFEGIKIPQEYNLDKISELFKKYGFMGKEYNYAGKRICNALKKADIIYIKHLYKKTKANILYIQAIGESAYKSFYFFLKTIFSEIE